MAAHRPSISNDTLELKHARIDIKLRKPLFSGMESVKYANPSLKRDPTVWFDNFFFNRRNGMKFGQNGGVGAPTNSFQE